MRAEATSFDAGADAFANATALSFPVALLLSVVNGAYEELFLTRYLVDTLARYGASVALGVSALGRVTYHLYQGPLGAVSVWAFGLVVTVSYWRFGELRPVMSAHVLADLAALL
jgi:membrane protease YdiL (CAAX protease family)